MDVNLDPLTTIVRLALINFKPGHIKVGISATGINLFSDTWFDRSRRTLHYWLGNGCSRDFLFVLRPPLQKAVAMYRDRFPLLFELAYGGLERLKSSYECGNVSETITLAMRALQDPADTLSSTNDAWTDHEIEALLVWLNLLHADPGKSYIADCIELFLDGKANELKDSLINTQPREP